jgi:hypothetical protein
MVAGALGGAPLGCELPAGSRFMLATAVRSRKSYTINGRRIDQSDSEKRPYSSGGLRTLASSFSYDLPQFQIVSEVPDLQW